MILPGRLLCLLAFFLALLAPAWAQAHTRSETHSNWRIDGKTVHLTFTVPELEAKRLSPDGHTLPPIETVAAYVGRRVKAYAGKETCAPEAPPKPIQAAPGMERFELTFQCPSAKGLAVESTAFFGIVPTHTNFAQIQIGDQFIEQLITRDQPRLELQGEHSTEAIRNANFFKYVAMGVMHIFTGIDHQSFLLGLLLLSRRLKDLVFVITGFTVGHSITLALAVTGLLRPHGEYIDALVGLTIVLIGAEALAEHSNRPFFVAAGMGGILLVMTLLKVFGVGVLPFLLLFGCTIFATSYLTLAVHLREAGRLRMILTMVFGLIHGFGFAAGLIEMKLPAERLGELLLGFNVGVELGQLTLVLAVSLLTYGLVRARLALPRGMVMDFGSASLISLGLFWLVSRSIV